jgi:hypothetical protein
VIPRALAKIMWLLLMIAVVIIIATIAVWLLGVSEHWGGGICAVGGYLLFPWASRAFDRRWPKPRPGWAE